MLSVNGLPGTGQGRLSSMGGALRLWVKIGLIVRIGKPGCI